MEKVTFDGLYRGKSPSNHHLGECCFTFFFLHQINKSKELLLRSNMAEEVISYGGCEDLLALLLMEEILHPWSDTSQVVQDFYHHQ